MMGNEFEINLKIFLPFLFSEALFLSLKHLDRAFFLFPAHRQFSLEIMYNVQLSRRSRLHSLHAPLKGPATSRCRCPKKIFFSSLDTFLIVCQLSNVFVALPWVPHCGTAMRKPEKGNKHENIIQLLIIETYSLPAF